MLRLKSMGGMTVELDGAPVQIPEKAGILLVYLADTGEPARRSRLAGLLWSDLTEDRARANLRVTLTRLRTALGDHVGADRERVWLTSQPEYDGAAVGTGDPDEILGSYAGDLLAGVDAAEGTLIGEWVEARRESLRTTAMLALSEEALRTEHDHDWDRAWQLAERIIQIEPWNEQAHRTLIRAAHHRSGRSAALAQYERCVTALEANLGLAPEDDTTALADAIRSGPPGPALDRSVRPMRRNRIPTELTPFLGREAEVAQLRDRLLDQSYRLFTISGPGGVGKTRLAAEVANQVQDQFSDGVVWAPLASVTTAAEFASVVTDLLVPDSVSSIADPLQQLTAALDGRSLCLVLDNFEQLVDSTSGLVLDVLHECPDVTVLATSRQPFDVAAEDVFTLDGLPTPGPDDSDIGRSPAVRLFVDRAYRADKSFALSHENAADVAELCRRVDGVPLHLELAAARVSSTVPELNEHLSRAAELPGSPPKDAPDRHRTFTSVFQHSWDLLDESDQLALARLSVTRGGFDRAAAAALVHDDNETNAGRLTRMSLLTEERGGRYRFHELVRQAAEARLSSHDRAVAEANHAELYLGRVAAAERTLLSAEARSAAVPLLRDAENIRQAWNVAIRLGLTSTLAAAAHGLGHLFELAGRALDTEAMMAAAAEACRTGDLTPMEAADEAFFLRVQARQRAAWSMDDTTSTLCLRVAELLEDRPDRALDVAWAQLHHAQASYHLGDLPRAQQLLDECERTASGLDDPTLRAWSLLQRGRLQSTTSRFDEATATYDEAMQIFESIGDERGRGQTHSYLAVTYAEQSRVWDAFVADRLALEACETTGNRQLLSGRHENLAASLLLFGAFEEARKHTAEALAMYRRNAEFDMESYALAQHGECLLGLGELEAGEADMSRGIAMMRDEKFSFGLLYNLPPWTRHLQRTGRHEQAILTADELVEIGSDRDAQHYVITGAALRARSLAAIGRTDEAADLATTLWETIAGGSAPRLPWPVATLLDLAAAIDRTDGRRSAILDAAGEMHLETARSIGDPVLREGYLLEHPVSIELGTLVDR